MVALLLLLLLLFKKIQCIVVDVIKLQQVVQYYASRTVLCTMCVMVVRMQT